jgi:glutathionyl-hydroquinone reductase
MKPIGNSLMGFMLEKARVKQFVRLRTQPFSFRTLLVRLMGKLAGLISSFITI